MKKKPIIQTYYYGLLKSQHFIFEKSILVFFFFPFSEERKIVGFAVAFSWYFKKYYCHYKVEIYV